MAWAVETYEFYIGLEGISEDSPHWDGERTFNTKEEADQYVVAVQGNRPFINPLNPVPGRSITIKATIPVEIAHLG